MKIYPSFLKKLIAGEIDLSEYFVDEKTISASVFTALEIERMESGDIRINVMLDNGTKIGFYEAPLLRGNTVTLKGLKVISDIDIN